MRTAPIYPMSDHTPARRGRAAAWRLARDTARSGAALLAGGLISLVGIPVLALGLATLVLSPLGDLGAPFLAVMTGLVRPLARAERRRVRR